MARIELTEVLTQIGKLPTEQREVLLLAAIEELSYADIARVQRVPIGTVMSRLGRAREKLRRMQADAASRPKVNRNPQAPAIRTSAPVKHG